MKALLKYGILTTFMDIPDRRPYVYLPKPRDITHFDLLPDSPVDVLEKDKMRFGYARAETIQGIDILVYSYEGDE